MTWIEHNEKHRRNQEKQAKLAKTKNVFYWVIAFIGLVAFIILQHAT